MIDKNQDKWNGERLETNYYDDVAVEHLHRYAFALEYTRGKHVLDLASGEGYGSNLIASVSNSVIGVDISQEAVKHAQKKYQRPNLKFLQGSADKVPLESCSVDVVTSFETLEHHDKHEEMMMEIKRVLKPNGILIMSSPDKLNYSDIPNQKNPYHVKELYESEFKELIGKYFKNHKFLNQKMIYTSLLIPDILSASFTEYMGDHLSVTSHCKLQDALYNLCLASDGLLDDVGISCFDGGQALNFLFDSRLKDLEFKMKQSFSYKLGWSLIEPFRFLRKLLHFNKQN